MDKPRNRPANPCFSSGPTSKRPGWRLEGLNLSSLGRSHRAAGPKARLKKVIDDSRSILGLPDDYLLGIVPASDTGAFEMALWTMLGERGVDVLHWESFGKGWVTDITGQLGLEDVREFSAPYGELPDLSLADTENRDVVFTWNGTTSGVRVPDAKWISGDRNGLSFCDATSAVFAMEVDWSGIDVASWSWQKVLGGEAGHGMLVLSPAAVDRLENWTPDRPLPKIFRLVKNGRLMADIFEGATINTPSMLAVEDQIDALTWAQDIGGLPALIERSEANLRVLESWIEDCPWAAFLATDSRTRSSTSICLKITDPWFTDQELPEQRATIKTMVGLLEEEGVAFDIGGYRDAPPGIRIWGGSTVESGDIEALTPWLDWAWSVIRCG